MRNQSTFLQYFRKKKLVKNSNKDDFSFIILNIKFWKIYTYLKKLFCQLKQTKLIFFKNFCANAKKRTIQITIQITLIIYIKIEQIIIELSNVTWKT